MIQTSDGRKGGLLDGDFHSAPSGGISAVIVTDNNAPVLLEKNEVIINRKSVADPTERTLTGTNKQILSSINISGGGVPIYEQGGEIQPEQKNKYSGYDYTNPEELERAKNVDLLTLPALVSGTNCSNCLWYSNNFCTNEKIKLPVNYRMCCALWDNSDALRSWETNSPNKTNMENTNSDEILKGGRADGKAIWDIAIKFNVPIDYAMEQLDKGLEEEKEHTPDFKTRYEIALDHLYDDIEYYNKLKNVEGMAKGGEIKVTEGNYPSGAELWRVSQKNTNDIGIFPKRLYPTKEDAIKAYKAKVEKKEKGGEIDPELEKEYSEIQKSGVNRQQAEFVLAFMGSIESIQKLGKERLYNQLIKIPEIGESSANKIVEYFKDGAGKYWRRKTPDYLLNFDEYLSKYQISPKREKLAKKSYLQEVKEAAEKNLYQQAILQGEISAIKAQNILEEAGLHVPEEIREATAEEVEEIAEELDEIKEKRMKEAQEFENFKKQAIIAEPMTRETTKAEVLESLEALKVSYDLSSGKEKELIGEAIEAMQVMYDNMPDVLCCGGYVLKQGGETITETYN